MGRVALTALHVRHRNETYARGEKERANHARGYQLHLEALDRRRKAGVDRELWRMVRVA